MPASSRRKRIVQSSDSEGGPATSLNTSRVDTSKKQQDADIGDASSGSESESEIVLSQSAKGGSWKYSQYRKCSVSYRTHAHAWM